MTSLIAWIIFALCIAAIAYVLFLYLEARLEVRSSPREPMFECAKHGVFRKKHLITFLDNEWCPLCLNEKIKVPLDSSIAPKD